MLSHSVSLTYYHLLKASIIPTIRAINITTANTPAIGIHNGLSTHHQFQSMLFVSFSTMNRISSTPVTFNPLSIFSLIIKIHHHKHYYHNCHIHPILLGMFLDILFHNDLK